MREMKNSGVAWIGEIPANWRTSRLKDYVDAHFGGCWGEDVKNNQNDVLCIRIADFDFANQSVKNTAETYRNYTDEQIKKYLLKDKDLIVEKSGGGDKTPVGRVVIYSEKDFPRAIFANFCECIRLSSSINHNFVAYCLKALYQTFDMHYYFNQTTGLQNLNIPLYLNAKICVPLLVEQAEIVTILNYKCGQVNTLISNQEAQIEKLKQYKQSLITEVVTKGLNSNAEMKDSGVEWVGKIPKDWQVVANKHLMCKVKNIREKYNGEDVLSLTMKGVIVRDLENPSGKMPATFDGYQFVEKDNLLMCLFDIDVTPRCIGLIKNNGVCSPAYSQFKLNEKADANYYYYYYLNLDNTKELLHLAKNLRHSLTEEQLGFIPTVLPSLAEQKEISDYLDTQCVKIDKLIEIKQSKIAKLNEYKKSLIYEYVTGKKEVDNL